jgi:hypothetical protein
VAGRCISRVTLSLAVTAAALAGGIAVTYFYDRRATFAWRIPDGLCIGLASLGLVGLAIAMRIGLTPAVTITAAALTASPSLLLLEPRYRRRVMDDLSVSVRTLVDARSRLTVANVLTVALCLLGVVLLWRVAGRSMFVRADGIYTGVSHNIGDLPFHLTVMSRFLDGQNLPPEHPSFAGAGFTYPFLTDFLGAMQLALGSSRRNVIVWPMFVLLIAFAALLYRWTLELTANRTAALLALPIAFFSGGLGWWRIVGEAGAAGLSLLASLPHDYTITADGTYRWGNLVTALLVTQRGLLLGLPLALIIFRLLWESADDDPAPVRMIAAGVLAGILPLVHAHSYAVVLGVAGCLMLAGPRRWKWLPFFAWSLSLGLPQIWWLTSLGSVKGQSFIGWAFGWDHGSRHIIVFWLANTGVFIPLVLAGLLWRGRSEIVSNRLRVYYVPFILCFIVPNVVRLAPWIWDNVKVLVYWFIASVPIAAVVLARLAEGKRWRTALAGVLLFTLTCAGALDVWRVASGAFASRVYDRNGVAFARLVTESTPPGALIVHAPTYNHPVGLSGRRSFMGYPGHVWSHGLDGGPREADIRRMYAGGDDADEVLKAHHIDYLVVGPEERRWGIASEPFFARYPLIIDASGYRLYRIEDDRHQ